MTRSLAAVIAGLLLASGCSCNVRPGVTDGGDAGGTANSGGGSEQGGGSGGGIAGGSGGGSAGGDAGGAAGGDAGGAAGGAAGGSAGGSAGGTAGGSVACVPSGAELCGDGLDNDCDRLVDGADLSDCPAIRVDIAAWSDPLTVVHGKTQNLTASISPTDTTLAWTRVWRVASAAPAATCAISDVTLSGQTDAVAQTTTIAQMPNTFAKLGCIYTVEVTVNGYAKDTVRLEVINRRPNISSVTGAIFDGIAWRMFPVAGSTPSFAVTASDLDTDSPLLFDFAGADASRLSCAPNCATTDATAPYSATVSFGGAAPPPGTYRLTLRVGDGFDPTPTSVDLVIEIDTCVWVRAGGTGSGATPATPMGSIQAAADTAKNSVNASVCVQGSGVFTENLLLPVAPNTPDVYGGYANTGASDASQRPIVEVSIAAGVRFAAGHRGKVRHLALRQLAGAPLTGLQAAIITVADASPELIDLNLTLGVGAPPLGLEVTDDASVTAPTLPRLTASTITATATTGPNAVGVRSTRGTGVPDVVVSRTSITAINLACPVFCRGVWVDRAHATVTGDSNISLTAATGSVVAVDVMGRAGVTATAIIRDSSLQAATTNGPVTVAVRLSETADVVIADNAMVGSPWSSAGREFSAGIADGSVNRAGMVIRGLSTNLTVTGNEIIGAGSSFWASCTLTSGGEGVDVAAGIFLAGTQVATISGNGRTGDANGGIHGGASTVHWAPAARRLPPSAVGVWQVDTLGVLLSGNEVRAGAYTVVTGCPAPSEVPAAIGYRDGLPPNPAFGVTVGSLPSGRARLDGNGISCARPPQSGGAPGAGPTWCVAAELNAPGASGGAAVTLTNNSIAATKGNFCVALRQRGGSGVVAANNTFDTDLMLESWEPQPPAGTIVKWAVLLEQLAPSGILLANNIFYAHVDNPADAVAERLLIREVTASGTSSRIGLMENNLFFIQGDDTTVAGPKYVRVTDGTSTATYDSTQLNGVVGVATQAGNFARPPGLTEPTNDWAKSTARLLPGSAAIDQGKPAGGMVPTKDIDGDTRPNGAAPDVGHDER